MGANFGSIVTELAIDRRKWTAGLNEAREHFGKFTVDTRRMSAALGGPGGISGGSRNATFALLELSRGAEDAASQFQTQGLAGAVRASANNMATLATIINPMAGVVVGLGAALATVLIPRLVEAGAGFENAAEKAKRLKDQTEGLLDATKEAREAREKRAGFFGALGGKEEDRSAATADVRARLAGRRTELADITKAQADARLDLQGAVMGGDQDRIKEREFVLSELAKKREVVLKGIIADENDLKIAEGRLAAAVRKRVDIETAPKLGGETNTQRQLKAEARAKFIFERDLREESDRMALVQGLTGGVARARRQREMVGANARSFERPEAIEFGSAMDKILDIAAAKGQAKQEAELKRQTEKLDKLIEQGQKLIDAVKSGKGLPAARLN